MLGPFYAYAPARGRLHGPRGPPWNPAWLPFCNVQFRMGQFLAKQGKDQWLVLVGKAPEEWYRAPQWVGEGMDVDRRSIV